MVRPIAEALDGLPCERILDLACGPGVLASALAPLAGSLLAFDLTRDALRVARRRAGEAGVVNLRPACALAEQLPLRRDSVDAVVLRLAIHHMDHPERALDEVARVLRPGGRLVVLDVLGSDDPGRSELHEAIERLRDPSHVRLRPKADLGALLAGAGLAPVAERTWATPREFAEWARIIAEPVRMDSLEVVLRSMCRAGLDTGLELRERDGALWLTYRWVLLTAERRREDS